MVELPLRARCKHLFPDLDEGPSSVCVVLHAVLLSSVQAHPVLWIPQFLAAVGGYLINWASTSYLAFKADTAAAMAAFCMGLFGSLTHYSCWW